MADQVRTVEAREPSFTAMIHAWLRNAHATSHVPPILSDTRSVLLVPEEAYGRIASLVGSWSREALDEALLCSVVRQRVLADRLQPADARGVRQLVILGAGLDTTAFSLPSWGIEWTVFEVDHPATQAWKRQRIVDLGWSVPSNLVFAPCDFERQGIRSALASAGFESRQPALVTLFGVILYLTVDATRGTLAELGTLAAGSEVTLSYSSPPDGTDSVIQEIFDRGAPVVAESGESFVGYYSDSQMEAMVREAGFSSVMHYPIARLNADYLAGRPDGLRWRGIEGVLTAFR
jgi:methyltransferase (TIGR00027 family)